MIRAEISLKFITKVITYTGWPLFQTFPGFQNHCFYLVNFYINDQRFTKLMILFKISGYSRLAIAHLDAFSFYLFLN